MIPDSVTPNLPLATCDFIYIEVILPLSIPKTLTFKVPVAQKNQLELGKRVVVSIKKSKLYTGIIWKIYDEFTPEYEIKEIEYIFDEIAIVNAKQRTLWQWMADYYLASLGEVMISALPAYLKLSSETTVILPNELVAADLSDKERMIYAFVKDKKSASTSDIQKYLQQKNVLPILKGLFEKGVLLIEEQLKDRYKIKQTAYVGFHPSILDDADLEKIFQQLEKKAPKQVQILLFFVQQIKEGKWNEIEIKKSLLLKSTETSEAALQGLVQKNILQINYHRESRLVISKVSNHVFPVLSSDQNEALKKVQENWKKTDTVLLHGITSSGKTEVYIHLIQKELDAGKQVLFLLPEIGLTTQMIERLTRYFGADVGVYHSRFSDAERTEIWEKQMSLKPYKIILGTRSSLFLPFQDLGLIIVDEEQEYSYKQMSPSPRYHGRDSSVMLGQIHQAKVLLGSATPSFESFYNVQKGKYGMANLSVRFSQTKLPKIEIIDIKQATRKKQMRSHFSDVLLNQIKSTLEQKQKVILFQNRRGFSLFLQCDSCDHIEKCKNCDVHLTYHKSERKLKCHYCGYFLPADIACRSCGSVDIKVRGFGTEKVEEDLQIFFPEAKIQRMDLDTTRGKNAFQQIISDFESGEIDVLVGTQMVTKGLDFKEVGLVGILNADNLLNFPDFRTNERCFQLMTQVAGRAGRNGEEACVMIQTFTPHHPVFSKVIENDYLGIYEKEMEERFQYGYSPYVRMISLSLRCKSKDVLEKGADAFASLLRQHLKSLVLGPEFPYIERIKNLYQKNILIKVIDKNAVMQEKQTIKNIALSFSIDPKYRSIFISKDVDPL